MTGVRAGEEWHQDHERHDREVLKQRDGHGDAARRRIDFAPLVVDLEHDGGRRHGGEAAVEPGAPSRDAESHRDQRDRADGQGHLERPTLDDRSTEPDDARKGQLEPDGEEQQHDANLGQPGDRVRFANEAERVRPDRDPGEQEADHRRYPEAVGQRYDRNRDGDENEKVAEGRELVHGRKVVGLE